MQRKTKLHHTQRTDGTGAMRPTIADFDLKLESRVCPKQLRCKIEEERRNIDG